MKFTNSSLVTYTNISNHKSKNRTHIIDTITPHVIVGQWTAKKGCDYFKNTTRDCSANYVIGTNGEVGLSVEEKDRAWTSSSSSNDNRAVTIEMASDAKTPYAINDKVLDTLIELCVDICKRNNLNKVVYFPDKTTALAYIRKDRECLITKHNFFANKSCPGPDVEKKLPYIVQQINNRLNNSVIEPTKPKIQIAKCNPQLHKGSKGAEVKVLQHNLNLCGYSLEEDSSFGSLTNAAFRDWQKKNGLVVDGYYGPKSMTQMDKVLNG